jgi:MFS family permease
MLTNSFSSVRFSRDARLLTATTGIFAISFLGIQLLVKVLYILRLGFGVDYVGIFGATGALAYMAMSLPSGALGAYWGARRTMLIGGVVTILGMASLPLVEYLPPHLRPIWPIVAQAVTSGGWAFFNVNLVPALMAATTPENRNQAYAMNSVMRGMGAFVGAIAGGLLPTLFAHTLGYGLDAPAPYRLSLWVSALLGLIALVPMAQVPPAAPITVQSRNQPRESFPLWLLILLVLHVYFAQIGIAVCQTFCSAYMDTTLNLSPAAIGLITGMGQFAAILAPLFAPRLAKRYGNAWLLGATTVGAALSLLPLALASHWLGVAVGGLGVTALAAMWMPTLQVFQMELVDAQWRSLAYGILSMAMSLTYASTSFLGGQIAAQWGYHRLFLLGIGLCLLGVGIMRLIVQHPRLRVEVVRSVS